MRARIQEVATGLFIRRGYRGVSFGDIAEVLGITRANIHYHFGNKLTLLEEVLEDYVDNTLSAFRAIWGDARLSFAEKIEATAAFNRQRYGRFNAGRTGGQPWSLISRMRNESDVIGERASRTLRRFARELAAYIEEAVAAAIHTGELAETTPVADVVVQVVSIANSAGPITQDAGNFERLDALYDAFLRTTQAAYGARAAGPEAGAEATRPSRRKPAKTPN